MADAPASEKQDLMKTLQESMESLAAEAASFAERTQRAAELSVKARECAELYAGM
jgi:hypothetical protein